MTSTQLGAIGIIRVSQPGDREGASFSSPQDQRDKIQTFCDARGWDLEFYEPELRVSGDALLQDRPVLSRAVMAVQGGSRRFIVAADTSRLWWNHETAALVKRLVQDAGGEVWTVDAGRLSDESPTDELNGTMHTAVDRFSRRQNSAKSRTAVQRAIRRGVPPWPQVTPGYRKREDGTYEPAATRRAVARAFALRVSGATLGDVRELLRGQGLDLSYAAVGRLLASRAVLGEIHFGTYEPNLSAHEPIVDREIWKAAQRVKVPAGRKAKSERLLARLGVLRCGSCGGRMSASTGHRGTFAIYRCGAHAGDPCPRRVTISAELVEGIVVDAVKAALADAEGRASAEQGAQRAADALKRAQAELDALIGLLDPLEPAARRRLEAATAKRDRAQAEVDRLGGTRASLTIRAVDDWDRLSLDARRALIRATVERVVVAPGRGVDRVTVELVG
jgi:site-specific DNA recombinase